MRSFAIDGEDDELPDTPTYLTVSGQLHNEMYACVLSKAYTFEPTFRAENSNTTRYLAKFLMGRRWHLLGLTSAYALPRVPSSILWLTPSMRVSKITNFEQEV